MIDLTRPLVTVAVFEIDDDTFHGHARFLRHLDELRATRMLEIEPETGFSLWEGKVSPCYVIALANLPMVKTWIANQNAIATFSPDGTSRVIADFGPGGNGKVVHRGVTMRHERGDDVLGYTMLRSGCYIIS